MSESCAVFCERGKVGDEDETERLERDRGWRGKWLRRQYLNL